MIKAQKERLMTGCLGREEIEVSYPPENSVLISLTDPGSPAPRLRDGWEDVLYLKFWDVTETYIAKEEGMEERILTPITQDQAQRIYDFIQKYQDKHINAHCEAGVSRSGAVREFLIRKGWNIGQRQTRRMVFPNIIVLNKLERIDRNEE